MINFTKELPQNTTVIQSEHKKYKKVPMGSAIQRQLSISAVLHASDAVFTLSRLPNGKRTTTLGHFNLDFR